MTGKSGDGGIDGMGTYRLSLVSFPVSVACRSAGSPDLQLGVDVGALAGAGG